MSIASLRLSTPAKAHPAVATGALGDSACHEGAYVDRPKRANLTVGKVGQFHAGECLIHSGTVCGTQVAGDAEVTVAPHIDHLTYGDGEGPVDFFALRHVADESGAVAVCVLTAAAGAVAADRLPVEVMLPACMGTTPMMALKRVDLPEPFIPIRPQIRPVPRVKEAPVRAWTGP